MGMRMNCVQNRRRIPALLVAAGLVATCVASKKLTSSATVSEGYDRAEFEQFVSSNCIECHDKETKTGGLALDELVASDFSAHPNVWERVIRKLSTRQMPPAKKAKPAEEDYERATHWLSGTLDDVAAGHPNAGRIDSLRRLTRTEYQNAIRDLLDLDVDAAELLPPDESSHGFDNITVTGLAPALLNRYLTAAETISRLAVGRPVQVPSEEVFRLRADVTQDVHIEGLPIGTRGGLAIRHDFPATGEYELRVRLMRDRNDEVESLNETHELEVLLDRQRMDLFRLEPTNKVGQQEYDARLKTRMQITAGPHDVGVTFLAKSASLLETKRQPLNVHFNFYRHPRLGPAVYQVSLIGPYKASGSATTPSRARIFITSPKGANEEEGCAKTILTNLLRRAYRRNVDQDDLKTPVEFYRNGREHGDFDAGIELALRSILVSPQFLFHIERDPPGVPAATAYKISDFELASRLSFFLWSSIPDDELLDLAGRNELSRPKVLEQQVERMLADKRSESLATNFAAQWLYLRNLDAVNPDMRLYQDFDDNLRQAMRRETELFFQSVVREDRSVLDFVKANDTFLNERLAKHYGIPHVFGSQFRRVQLEPDSKRGGLLRQASILSVTSFATRTSPVVRGQWVLKNFLGAEAPPPPPNVPVLKENTVSAKLAIRDRLKQHRANETCAKCHDMIDPVGFALENFDPVGRFRVLAEDEPVDARGGFLDGSEFHGAAGLEQTLLKRPELFVRTLVEKLMTFALGRGVEDYDAPAIRKIVADSRDEYRFSRLILGIVRSTPFRMRMSP
jgi:hypothetical protein